MRFKVGMLALALTGMLGASVHSVQAEDLLDIYNEAYLRDPVVLQAKANRDRAVAAIDEATAALLPQLNLTGSLNYTRINPAGDTSSYNNRAASGGIDLSQAIWRHSSWVNRDIATKTAAQQELVYADALQQLIIRVSTAYFNVLNALDTVTFAKANQAALKRQLDEATRRFHVGLIAETDQLEAQAAYDLATAQVITAENNLINSYEEIRKLIGRQVTELNALDEGRFSPMPVVRSISQVVAEAEQNNLNLQANIISRDIAKDQITLAQTGHEPTLDLVGSLQMANNNYSVDSPSLQDGTSNNASVGVALNFPLFSGGAVSSQVEQAQHNYVAASEALELVHRTMISDANNNYNNVQAAISSVIAYQQTERSAQSALEATQAGYEVGTRTISDVLDATQQLYSAKQSLSAARFNYILSRLQLLYTQGTLSLDEIEAVNRGLKRTATSAPTISHANGQGAFTPAANSSSANSTNGNTNGTNNAAGNDGADGNNGANSNN